MIQLLHACRRISGVVNSTSMTRKDEPMSDTALRATEAARRLGVPTKELLRLIQSKQIRYVMVDGIAHVPEDALEEFQARMA